MPLRNHGLMRDKRPLGAQHIIGSLKHGIAIKDPLFMSCRMEIGKIVAMKA